MGWGSEKSRKQKPQSVSAQLGLLGDVNQLNVAGDGTPIVTESLTRSKPKLWNDIYKRRSSVERSNKREKIDYHLEAGKHCSTMMWYIRIYGIMICQHIDAWYAIAKMKSCFSKTKFFLPSPNSKLYHF